MIIYVKGNLLDAPQNLIAHQVNCQGVMGSGVAKAIRDKYPNVYTAFVGIKPVMGMVQIVEVAGDKEVCNIFAQRDYLPRGMRHTSYDALTKGFEFIKSVHKGDIALPKIGCGLGGGDWKVVSAIIESVFNDRDVYVYDL